MSHFLDCSLCRPRTMLGFKSGGVQDMSQPYRPPSLQGAQLTSSIHTQNIKPTSNASQQGTFHCTASETPGLGSLSAHHQSSAPVQPPNHPTQQGTSDPAPPQHELYSRMVRGNVIHANDAPQQATTEQHHSSHGVAVSDDPYALDRPPPTLAAASTTWSAVSSRRDSSLSKLAAAEALLDAQQRALAKTAGKAGAAGPTLQEENIGYQLLKKSGWREGTGLGANEQVCGWWAGKLPSWLGCFFARCRGCALGCKAYCHSVLSQTCMQLWA